MINARSTNDYRKASAVAFAAGLMMCAAGAANANDDAFAAPEGYAQEDGAAPTAYQGAKKSVAVIDFSANGAFLSRYGDWTEGAGLAAMFASELAETGRFRVVNRSHLDSTLYEQQLNVNGLTARPTAQPGQLVGAQYLVRGSVTDFTLAEKGGGISVGGNIGGVLGAISPRTQKGRISIDFSVIDSTSGEVIASFPVTKKIKSTAIAARVSKNNINVGGNTFKNTPLGEAAREAIAEAAARLTDALADKAWTAHVANVGATSLYVNAGADSGLHPGDRLTITRVSQRIVDPVTGALLGVEKHRVGEAVIDSVQDQYATAFYDAAVPPQPGDLLTLETTPIAQLATTETVQ